jgi:hypothetical protein
MYAYVLLQQDRYLKKRGGVVSAGQMRMNKTGGEGGRRWGGKGRGDVVRDFGRGIIRFGQI